MVNFDPFLELFVKDFLKSSKTHQITYALDQNFINTFDEFRIFDVEDMHKWTYKVPGSSATDPDLYLHIGCIKTITRGTYYCRSLVDDNDADCDDPTNWTYEAFNIWRRNMCTAYVAKLSNAAIALQPAAIGSTGPAFLTTAQKDDDAALVSWNRKPRDVAKYPLLKADDGYQDWKLKMKRQLIADTLHRVTEPIFSISKCRIGSDMELGRLQVNFFEQILSAVLLNPEGKSLVITHPEDSLYIWKHLELHQTDSDSAQISTTALMNKLLALK
jgi:hypothetical protein